MKGQYYTIMLLIVLLAGCTIKPQPIAYGSDGCHFCRMTIVDTQHAAQFVTKKGKVFKFDAIECMINYQKEIDTNDIALYLCNHFTNPGELIDATEATFLVSEGIPSPMGEFLTAFGTRPEAETEKTKHGGTLFTWNGLLEEFNK